MIRNQRAFTLIEMVVVMAVFMTVLIISASTFNTVLVQSSKVFRSEESNIEGVIGLEILRHDLQQSGYGLFSEAAVYLYEAASTPALDYNDAPNNTPRPIVVGNNLTSKSSGTKSIMEGSDYLVIKGTSVARTKSVQKWTFLKNSSGVISPQKWVSGAENFTTNDKVIVVQKQFGSNVRSTLVPAPSGKIYYEYSDAGFRNLSSASAGVYTVYGIASPDTTAAKFFPFNRSDYFVARPDDASVPAYCAPNTGILYKTTVNHSDGGLNDVPILDCVLDMQVVLGWDVNTDGVIDTWSNADGSAVNGLGTTTEIRNALGTTNNNSITALPNIRNNLKTIKVYIIVQNGKKDTGYTSTSPLEGGESGEASLTRPAGFPLAADQMNYRWKLYRVIVRPKNLLSNQ